MKLPPPARTIVPTMTTSPAGHPFWGYEFWPREQGERPHLPTLLHDTWPGEGMPNEYRLDPSVLGDAPTIVDLGANVGAFTLGAAARIPFARILAVEPNHLAYGCLVKNVLEAGVGDRVAPARYAVAAENGTCILVQNLTGSCMVSFDEYRGLDPGYLFGGMIGAYARTLAWLLDEYEIEEVDFLKVDIEGSEVAAFLATPSDVLARVKRIAMELHAKPGQDEMIEHVGRTHRVKVEGYLFAERL